jgi:hypothetical protein
LIQLREGAVISGGHFDYQQYRLYDMAFDIEKLIEANRDKPKSYGPGTIERFNEAAQTLKRAAEMVTRIDWLVSGDDDEDDFHERWNEAIARIEHDEVRSVLMLLDGLADQWGDEAVFRRCRDRLRDLTRVD